MDDEMFPSSSHATAIPSSPPLDRSYRSLSPTSSIPPEFSSDGPLESADLSNYESPREKRKRVGGWWEMESSRPLPERKKAKMSRNFDSGIWLQSDGSSSSQDTVSIGLPSSDPVIPESFLAPQLPSYRNVQRPTEHISAAEAYLRRTIQHSLEQGSVVYNLDELDLHDHELCHISDLKQVIQAPPDSSVDVPAEGQYRSWVPKLYINLARNNLALLNPSLFELQFLTTLVLRDNNITELPPQIGDLHNLEELDISRNSIRWLPFEILQLIPQEGGSQKGSLKRLPSIGNPFLDRPNINSSTSRAVFYQFPWEEVDQSTLLSPSSANAPVRFRRRIARTPVVYYDQIGHVIKGSAVFPLSGETGVDAIFDLGLHSYNVPSVWFEPPKRSRVPTLFNMSMNVALNHASPEDIHYQLGGDPPAEAEVILAQAERNEASVYRPFRKCHVCEKDYVIPAAEWVELWMLPFTTKLPIMVRVCSWGCVPDKLAGKPQEPF